MSLDPIVNQVASRNDIVEIISEYLPLKKAGRNFKACCPFHEERSASFVVNPERQIFHCFGCHAGGDVFSFVMKVENLNFPEALQKLANRVQMVLPDRKQGGGRIGGAPTGKKEKLYEIGRLSAEYYQNVYKDPQLGAQAQKYMLDRNYSPQVIDMYKVGYATDAWQGLYEFLRKKGYSDALLLDSGLIRKSEKGRLFDLFRKRVIFPILNTQGKVVAFGGRILGNDGNPKYLNSPETETFQKRSIFYGLDLAKKNLRTDKAQLIIVEGYLDVLSLTQYEFTNSIATLGTSLTKEHCYLLKRYVDEAILIYDGDKAGEAASLRGIDVLIEEGMNVKLLSLPSGKDPDDFLKEQGREAFQNLLNEAKDVFDYKLAYLLKVHDVNDATGLVKITNEFLELLSKVKNSVLVDRYLRRLSHEISVDEVSLRNEYKKFIAKQKKSPNVTASVSKGSQNEKTSLVQHEWQLLQLVTQYKEYKETLLSHLNELDFFDLEARKVFRFLKQKQMDEGGNVSINEILPQIVDEKKKSYFVSLSFMDMSEEDVHKAFHDCLKKAQLSNYDIKLKDLMSKMKQAEANGNKVEASKYMKLYQTLLSERKVVA